MDCLPADISRFVPAPHERKGTKRLIGGMTMQIDEPVHLEPYDESWRELYLSERERLLRSVGELTKAIEHFGSTSVPGMTAKPIIDILVGVEDPSAAADEIIRRLNGIGYEHLGEAGIPGRRYFRQRGLHDYNVHVVQYRGELWNNNLLLRDYLREHPEEAQRYSDMKEHILERDAQTLLSYSDQKHAFVSGLLERAAAWAGA
ncbi:GrpB family protein [Paenibacillus lactis]|uniref:GrpB family protein n=2 Tax=Paenibacillus lactis TaxID=228574 RepID=G4HK55_9BACL|nr:GrpB family protein [Paenibacillus lactis]EHB62256.1 protein of unknown function UPF0157 [Paenibacillus lactis 154]MBP1895609.1 GrpB-like predicted nucleotidyltransferase (UPF0157 family) [Paenibacillus lactis]